MSVPIVKRQKAAALLNPRPRPGAKKKMSQPEADNPKANPKANGKDSTSSTAGESRESRFDTFSAAVPDSIGGQPEVLSPETETAESGWPVWNVEQIASLPFLYLAKRYGAQWELDGEELSRFATAWKPILDRYLPLEAQQSDLGTAIFITLAIVGPRALATDWKPIKPATREAQTASTKAAGSTESPSSLGSAKAGSQPEWDPFSQSVAV